MPIEHSIAHRKYIVFRATGAVTGADIIEANRWLYTEFQDNDVAKFQLWDFSTATQIVVDIEMNPVMAEQDKQAVQKLSRLVIACVAPGDLIFGLTRMLQAFADNEAIQSHVFRDLVSAENWIHSKM